MALGQNSVSNTVPTTPDRVWRWEGLGWTPETVLKNPDQREAIKKTVDSLAEIAVAINGGAGINYFNGSTRPFLDPDGRVRHLVPILGPRTTEKNERLIFPTDIVALTAYLSFLLDIDPVLHDGSSQATDRALNNYFDTIRQKVDGEVVEGFLEEVRADRRGDFSVLVGLLQSKSVGLDERAGKKKEEAEAIRAEEASSGKAVRAVDDVATAKVGGGATESATQGGEGGTPSESEAQGQPGDQTTQPPQPADARQPLVSDAERARRQSYAYESAWLKNAILQDLCRQHGVDPSPQLMNSLQEVVADSIGNMTQEELGGLFANTSGRLQQLREIQTRLSSNVLFVQELNQLYDARYIALAKVDENQARAFRENTDYIPSQRAVKEVQFASEEKLQAQLDNPVDAGVNQAINQLTGHEALSADQLRSLEVVLTQLATGLGDKTLAAELGLPTNPNRLDIGEYIQSLDEVAVYRLLYGAGAKPNKEVLTKLRANLNQVKHNLTSTCQTILTQKSIEFRVESFANGASAHASDINPAGDLRESPMDIASRVVPIMSGSLLAPEVVALAQSESRLSESTKAQQEFVRRFSTTFNALDRDTQKMLILAAGMDPEMMKDFDGSYKFDDQLMRAAGRLSQTLRDANQVREIKRKIDERLKQSHALTSAQAQELERLSGDLKRLGLHAEANQLQLALKESFKSQLNPNQKHVFEHIEQLSIAERALQEAEFQVRIAQTHRNQVVAGVPATEVLGDYLAARSAAFAAGSAADQALKKLVDLPPEQREIASELAEKRQRVGKQLSDLKSELSDTLTARQLGQNLSNEDYQKIFRDFADNATYTNSQGNQRQLWLPVSDEVYESGQFQEPTLIESEGGMGGYDDLSLDFSQDVPDGNFDLNYSDYLDGDDGGYGGGEEDLVDQYNQTVDGARRKGGKSKTRQLAGHIKKKVQAKRAAKKVAEEAVKKTAEGAVEAGSTLAGAASGPAGWIAKGAMVAAKVANMLRTKEGRKKLGMYASAIGGGGIMAYLALKGALGAAAGGFVGAIGGAALGAAIGSFIPVVGPLAGALIGGGVGAAVGYFNGGGSIFGLGGSGGATTAFPSAPAYYSPSAPEFVPASSSSSLASSQTMAGSGAGTPGLAEPIAGGTTRTASLSQQAIHDASAGFSGQPPASQFVSQPAGQWIDPAIGYRFNPSTGQVYNAAGQPVASAGTTIAPTTVAAGATTGAVGVAAVIGPLGLSGAAFFMPAISVLSVTLITLITIITIFAAFLTPTPGLFSDAGLGSETSKYGSITKTASPTKLPNNHGTSEINYSIKLEPNPGYQWQISSVSDATYFLPPMQPNPIITYLNPQPTASDFPSDPFADPQEYTYKATFVGGADVRVINRVVVKFQAVDRNGTVLPKTQTLMATAAVDIGNPKLGCFDFDTNGGVPIKEDWNQNNDLDDDETLYSIPMGIGDQNAVITAFMNRAGSNLRFYELVCSIDDTNPDGIGVKIHKFPNHPTQEYWGWVSASDFMVLYGPFYRAGPASQEYTFIHELGHIIDQRHMPSLRNDFKRVWRESVDGCFSYPFPEFCSLEEAFAEAIVVYVTGATTLPDWTPDGYPLKSRNPAVYNWVKENIFAGEEFYFKDM